MRFAVFGRELGGVRFRGWSKNEAGFGTSAPNTGEHKS
jgi:hypothetical protein